MHSPFVALTAGTAAGWSRTVPVPAGALFAAAVVAVVLVALAVRPVCDCAQAVTA